MTIIYRSMFSDDPKGTSDFHEALVHAAMLACLTGMCANPSLNEQTPQERAAQARDYALKVKPLAAAATNTLNLGG